MSHRNRHTHVWYCFVVFWGFNDHTCSHTRYIQSSAPQIRLFLNLPYIPPQTNMRSAWACPGVSPGFMTVSLCCRGLKLVCLITTHHYFTYKTSKGRSSKCLSSTWGGCLPSLGLKLSLIIRIKHTFLIWSMTPERVQEKHTLHTPPCDFVWRRMENSHSQAHRLPFKWPGEMKMLILWAWNYLLFLSGQDGVHKRKGSNKKDNISPFFGCPSAQSEMSSMWVIRSDCQPWTLLQAETWTCEHLRTDW